VSSELVFLSSCPFGFFSLFGRAAVKVHKTKEYTKFKVRCTKYLYTLVVKDSVKATKLQSSLPPSEPLALLIVVSCLSEHLLF
jgi:hypothetical protein